MIDLTFTALGCSFSISATLKPLRNAPSDEKDEPRTDFEVIPGDSCIL